MNSRVWARKIGHAGTWLPLVGLFTAAFLLPTVMPGSAMLATVTVSFFWLRFWWRRIDARVCRSVELEMIDESNRKQDERLRARMRFYRVRGTPHLASVLGTFLSAKRSFESRLARDDSHFSTHENMERLVDGLCIGICDELDGIAALDRRLGESIVADDDSLLNDIEEARRRHLKAVRDAYVTLADAVKALKRHRSESHLPEVCAAVRRRAESRAGSSPDLRNAISGLREESEISRNVRARLESAAAECLN